MTTTQNIVDGQLPFRPFNLDSRARWSESNEHENMDYMPTMLYLENLFKFACLLNDKTYKEMLTVDDTFWHSIESDPNKEYEPTNGESQF